MQVYVMCYERHLAPSEHAQMSYGSRTLQGGSELPRHCVPRAQHRSGTQGPWALALMEASGQAEAVPMHEAGGRARRGRG